MKEFEVWWDDLPEPAGPASRSIGEPKLRLQPFEICGPPRARRLCDGRP
jgi:hypothetical protein